MAEGRARHGSDDARWMALALEEARAAFAGGEVPVGAVIVCGDELVARNHNRTGERSDPTAHAEILALREAAEKLGDWRLTEHSLYVTLEPCAMCAGSLVAARIKRLVFATDDPKAGMCGSLANLVQDERLNHQMAVESGVMANEASELLRDFFQARR